MKKERHHVWCNHFYKPVKDCEFCKSLHKECPENDMTETELMAKHFPNNIKVENDKEL